MGKRKGKSQRNLPPVFPSDKKSRTRMVADVRPCPRCAGHGTLWEETGGAIPYIEFPCPHCKGSGKVGPGWLYAEK